MGTRAVPGSNKNMKRVLKLVVRVGLMLQWRGRDIRVDHMLPGDWIVGLGAIQATRKRYNAA